MGVVRNVKFRQNGIEKKKKRKKAKSKKKETRSRGKEEKKEVFKIGKDGIHILCLSVRSHM